MRFVIGNVNQFVWEPCLMAQISSMYCLVSHLCFDFLISHIYCIVSLDCVIDFFPSYSSTLTDCQHLDLITVTVLEAGMKVEGKL